MRLWLKKKYLVIVINRKGVVMKKKDKNTNKIVSNLNYFTSVCFYICSIINFINKNNSMGVVYLCLGSVFLCLGSVYLNKDGDKK